MKPGKDRKASAGPATRSPSNTLTQERVIAVGWVEYSKSEVYAIAKGRIPHTVRDRLRQQAAETVLVIEQGPDAVEKWNRAQERRERRYGL